MAANGAEPGGSEDGAAGRTGNPVALPSAVRQRVVALAAAALVRLPENDLPQSLRRMRAWTPARLGRLAATPIAAALDDGGFRAAIAAAVREEQPELTRLLDAGTPPASAPAVELAAVGWLLRVPGFADLVRAAADSGEQEASARAGRVAQATVERLQLRLDAALAMAARERAALTAERDAARAEAEQLRRRVRGAGDAARREARQAGEQAAAARAAAAGAERQAADAQAEVVRLTGLVAAAEARQGARRRAGRMADAADQARVALLVTTVQQAARGLVDELGLRPVLEGVLPADLVADSAVAGPDPFRAVPARGLSPDDPAALDLLLGLPGVHLIVDGYNVTKTGYGTLPLGAQRDRLAAGAAGLAARTGAEITLVFDGGAEPTARATPSAGRGGTRGVRVLFSAAGEIADTLVVRLVDAEPAGRPIVVVSSDREVVTAVVRLGARAVPSAALLGRLERP